MFVRLVDPQGEVRSITRLGSAFCDQGRAVIATRDGGILAVGFKGCEARPLPRIDVAAAVGP